MEKYVGIILRCWPLAIKFLGKSLFSTRSTSWWDWLVDGFILNEVVHVQLLFVEKPVISQRKGSKKNRNGAIPHYFEWWCSMQSCFPINFGAPYLEQRIVIDWIVHVRVSFFTKPAANNHQSGLSPSFWVSKSWWHRSQKLWEVNFRRCFLSWKYRFG